MTTVGDVVKAVEALAPPSLQMEWDNGGLLCGGSSRPVTKLLVALDPFEEVCREAAQWGAEVLVTHHPLIFRPVKAVTEETAVGRALLLLAKHNISAVNAHTSLDCAPGGVNDVLAETLGLTRVRPLEGDLLRAGWVEPMDLEAFLRRVQTRLGCPGLRYVNSDRPVEQVAVGGGACAGEMATAVAAGCDTFVTADVKYNQFWDARDLGIHLIDAGHFYTENPVCKVLAAKLQAAFPEITVRVSEKHRDCMKFWGK